MRTQGKQLTRIGLVVAVIAALAIIIIVLNSTNRNTRSYTVGVIEPMQHIAVSDITRGINDGLSESDLDIHILVSNANGDVSHVPPIISRYRDRQVDLYIPIFTSTSQATKSAITNAPIIFAAVTDPVSAGLLENPHIPGGNISGVSDLWPIGAELDLIRTILPAASRIGVVYDPGDPSSVTTLPVLREEAQTRGFELFERPVHVVNDVPQALSALEGRIDVLFTANDVTVTAAFSALVGFAVDHKIPLFAGDYSSVQRGAIAAVGQNYYAVGMAAAELASQVLRGTSPAEIPVTFTTGGDLYLNVAAADAMGVSLSDTLLSRALTIYNSISDSTGE